MQSIYSGCDTKVRHLNTEEKVLIKSLGLSPKYILRLSRTADNYKFLETRTGKQFDVRR